MKNDDSENLLFWLSVLNMVKITVLWGMVAGLVYYLMPDFAPYLILAGVLLLLAGIKFRSCLTLVPLIGDIYLAIRRHKRNKEYLEGRSILEMINYCRPLENTSDYKKRKHQIARLEQHPNGDQVLVIPRALPKINWTNLLGKISVFAAELGASAVYPLTPRNKYPLKVMLTAIDPLEAPITVDDLPPLDLKDYSVNVAVDSRGDDFRQSVYDKPLIIFAGSSGSGKTVGLKSFLLPFGLTSRSKVQIDILDGKGGSDLSVFQPRCENFISDDNIDIAINLLQHETNIMKHRIEMGLNSNLWEDDTVPLRILVVDECQEFFDDHGADKERKVKIARITSLMTSLVKRCRSAKMLVVLSTQKPTSESLPTGIIAQSSMTVCFRCFTKQQAIAAFGGSLPEDAYDPTQIPVDYKGVAVVGDGGVFEKVRFKRVEDETIKRLISESRSEDENYLTVKQLARMLGLSVSTVHRRIGSYDITHVKRNGMVLVPVWEAENLLLRILQERKQ